LQQHSKSKPYCLFLFVLFCVFCGHPIQWEIYMNNEFDDLDFAEITSSQIPALLQLSQLGYSYLSRKEVAALRESKHQYILRDFAFDALRKINNDNISDKSIRTAVFEMEQQIDMGEGVFRASEHIFSQLLAGRAVSELIDGRRVSPQLKFIDWKQWENNLYHVCAEFNLSEGHVRRPDIVLFVNGIPFAVIECKKESVKVEEAVNQMIRNQGRTETPKFFLFPQILIATNVQQLKFGTMLTPAKFYTLWKEKDADGKLFEGEVSKLINQPIASELQMKVAADVGCAKDFEPQKTQKARKITEQDRGIHSLLRPERMLDLVRNFILYDNGIKKIARYQQYFAIKKALKRLKTSDEFGKRRGGLIWHTQGSGKSLTMVMLVKCLIDDPEIPLPRIIVVTDRRDLDKQISDTFAACNIKKNVRKTASSKELLQLIREKDQRVLTTLIHKFETARYSRDFVDEDSNVFVLIDEAHRTQAGKANEELNLILPKACQIAFTGTPLMKKDKKSAVKFGGMIDTYTISEAEADGVILPLFYQPRLVEQTVQKKLLDRFYDRITEPLTDQQKKDLQKKFNSSNIIEQTSQRIETIALDILDHYSQFKDTGLKAQIVAPSKYAAIMFKKAFDLQDDIPTEVIISETVSPMADDLLPEHKRVVVEFLKSEKHKYGSSLESREKKLIADFKENPNGVRILIVVDKLLTGFDAPRNTFLYLTKQLRDHNLLQAIARVNRLFDGDEKKETKVSGLVIDYSKNAANLLSAMQLFSSYEPEDIERALLSSDEKIAQLDRIYQQLHSIFNNVRNKHDNEEYVRILEEDFETREHFYELVNKFIKQFSACRMLYDFTQKVDANKLRRYQNDLKKFLELKKIQKIKNAEVVDFSKYEDQIRRILDKYVSAEYVREMAKPVCVAESSEFNAYIENAERGLSNKSKAEAIAAQTQRTISENFHKDPEFYKRFSDKIKKLIASLREAKEEDAKTLLTQVRDIQGHVVDYEDNDIPSGLKECKASHPYFRNLKTELSDTALAQDQLCTITEEVTNIIEQHKIVDWHNNVEVQRRIRMELEDYLFDVVQEEYNASIDTNQIDRIISLMWDLAVENRDQKYS